jgi:diguanylate cyclase
MPQSSRPTSLSAAQLARETLKTLAAQRIEPTAENYARIYSELSGVSPSVDNTAAILPEMRELAVIALRSGLMPLLPTDHADRTALAGLANNVTEANGKAKLASLTAELIDIAQRMKEAHSLDAARTDALNQSLRALLAYVRDLVGDDQWLAQQIDEINQRSDEHDPRELFEVERRLRQLSSHQGQRRAGLSEAREKLKHMVTVFVDQMARVSESTGTYGEQIGALSQKASQAKDLGELGNLLSELTEHTQNVQGQLQQNREELLKARSEVEATQDKIRTLEHELISLNEQVREDPLTRALNRRGLDEAFRRESARSTRHGTPLSLGLIDIDHFKKLNDTHGHHAGDQALMHLTNVIKESMRPMDQLARIGGEEFVLMLPDTNEEQARVALVRFQRELTKRMFLQGEQRLLITFSAGVTQYRAGEELQAMQERADAALYQAKQQGRNLVLIAAP